MLLQNASNLDYTYNEVARIVLAVFLARLGFWIYNQYKARGDAAAQRDQAFSWRFNPAWDDHAVRPQRARRRLSDDRAVRRWGDVVDRYYTLRHHHIAVAHLRKRWQAIGTKLDKHVWSVEDRNVFRTKEVKKAQKNVWKVR